MKECQALILAPTRELAQQIQKVVLALGDYMDIAVHACVGGTAVRDDIRTLQNGVHIVVGTPGRVFDMINRRSLRLDSIRQFFLDEADEMLSRGFKDQIYDIFKFLPETVQVCLFSATMPLDVLEVTERFMREPVRILVNRGGHEIKTGHLFLDHLLPFLLIFWLHSGSYEQCVPAPAPTAVFLVCECDIAGLLLSLPGRK